MKKQVKKKEKRKRRRKRKESDFDQLKTKLGIIDENESFQHFTTMIQSDFKAPSSMRTLHP